MRHIEITESAIQDLLYGYQFYKSQSYNLGDYFLDSVMADIDSLMVYAGIHPIIYQHYRLLASRFPFAIYYRLDNQKIIVSAVLDCRQNPSFTREKLLEEQ